MLAFDEFDWSSGTEEEQLAMARGADVVQLRALACRYDWTLFPEKILGWAMAQKGMDLASALTVFFNGEPERFNYLPKRDVPGEFRGAARVLDNICLRVNSGFYLAQPGQAVQRRKQLEKWLAFQEADRKDGRQGRWILDEKIVGALQDDTLRFRVTVPTGGDEPDLRPRGFLGPVRKLGLGRIVRPRSPVRPLPPDDEVLKKLDSGEL